MHIALLCLLAIAVGNVLSLLLPKRTVSPELLHLASDFKLPTEDQKPSDHCVSVGRFVHKESADAQQDHVPGRLSGQSGSAQLGQRCDCRSSIRFNIVQAVSWPHRCVISGHEDQADGEGRCGLECSMNGHCAEGPGGPPIEVDRIFSRQRALGLMEATTEEISILPAIFEQQ